MFDDVQMSLIVTKSLQEFVTICGTLFSRERANIDSLSRVEDLIEFQASIEVALSASTETVTLW